MTQNVSSPKNRPESQPKGPCKTTQLNRHLKLVGAPTSYGTVVSEGVCRPFFMGGVADCAGDSLGFSGGMSRFITTDCKYACINHGEFCPKAIISSYNW